MDRSEAGALPLEESCSIMRFRIGPVELALFSEEVEEVTEPAEVTPIPCAPPHVPGIVAVRGEALPLFDVGRFLGLPGASTATEMPRMLIVRSRRYRVGVICDQVLGVTSVPKDRIQDPRVSGPPTVRQYALGEVEIAGRLAPLLNLDALLVAGRAR
jgi:purine-binding chemotaxis protein CheW